MTRFIKCPICNNQAKREYYTGPFGIEEEYIGCSTCNYEFEFAYGNYKEVVGNKYFIWSCRGSCAVWLSNSYIYY